MTVEELSARLAEIEGRLAATLLERDQYKQLYEMLHVEVERLRRGLFGQKAEHVDAAQAQLAFDAVRDLVLAAAERASASGEAAPGETAGSAPEPSAATPAGNGNAPPPPAPEPKKEPKVTPHGRSKLPEHLPVERIELLPPEVTAAPDAFDKIGEEVSEMLEWRSASLVRLVIVRPKFVRKTPVAPTATEAESSAEIESPAVVTDTPAPNDAADAARSPDAAIDTHAAAPASDDYAPAPASDDRAPAPPCELTSPRLPEAPSVPAELEPATPAAAPERAPSARGRASLSATLAADEPTVLIAELIDKPIARGRAGPGLLAHLLVCRFADHLPWHRLEKIFARYGVDLARSTLCDWGLACAELLAFIVAAMAKDALHAAWIGIDATGVLVQAKEQCRRGHFWVLVAERAHVLFRYTPRHTQDGPKEFLRGYKGYVQADASSVYEALYRDEDVTEVGCWAHTRRYFFDAMPSDNARALAGIGFINKLFAIERELQKLPPAGRLEERRARSAPLVDAFEAWVDVEMQAVLPKSPMAKAFGYAQNQRVALRRFLEDGRLRLDNNLSELELRRQAVGRKNWLFVGNDEAGESNAVVVSLVASCELHGLDPFAYLRDVLTVLPTFPRDRALELAPKSWKATRERLVAEGKLSG